MLKSRGEIRYSTLDAAGLSALCLTGALPVYGWDENPRDFIPAPAGTNLRLVHYLDSISDEFVDGNGNDVADSSLDVNTGFIRYVHYFDMAGMWADVNVLQPFGRSEQHEHRRDQHRHQEFFFGDLTLVGTIWPMSDLGNGRHFGVATYLTMPSGQYSATRPGLGSNRRSVAIQPGFLFNITPKWSVDLVGDVTIFSDNGDGLGGITVEKALSFIALGWLNYHASDSMTLSLGVKTNWGGAETARSVEGPGVSSPTARVA